MISHFGTDGMRNRIGTAHFTIENLPHIGRAIALWAQKKYKKYNPGILLIHDTRASCSFVKSALKSGLLLYPVTIYDALILPTPAALSIMKAVDFLDCSIIISASHNPWYDNGIKIMDTQGKLDTLDENLLTLLIEESVRTPPTYNTTYGTDHSFPSAQVLYTTSLLNIVQPHLLVGKKIVLDMANGALSTLAPALFKLYGAEVISIHAEPNGTNINEQCGSTHTSPLQKAVVTLQADAGFAFDGDGDRVIAVNKNGLLKNGDDLLALLSTHSSYKNSIALVGTTMTNEGLAEFLASHGKFLHRTPVGDRYIAKKLASENLIIGGEPSGHVILNDYLPNSDGLLTALKVLETLIQTDNWNMETFNHYEQVIVNVPIEHKVDLNLPPYADFLANVEKELDGRILVRFSGTEPLLRIMIESRQKNKAYPLAHNVAQHLHYLFSQNKVHTV
jgi:phosphoglucosamine mutase